VPHMPMPAPGPHRPESKILPAAGSLEVVCPNPHTPSVATREFYVGFADFRFQFRAPEILNFKPGRGATAALRDQHDPCLGTLPRSAGSHMEPAACAGAGNRVAGRHSRRHRLASACNRVGRRRSRRGRLQAPRAQILHGVPVP